MRRLAAVVVLGLGVALACPAFASADAAECEAGEAEIRASVADQGWTSEHVEAFAREGMAQCWDAVHEDEARRAEEAPQRHAEEERRAGELAQEGAEERRSQREERHEEQHHAHERRELKRRQREWAHKPTVTLYIARYEAKQRLDEAGFNNGWVECRGGRIDRTHWGCKVNLFYRGERSRMRVWGAGYRNHRPYFGTEAGHFHSRLD